MPECNGAGYTRWHSGWSSNQGLRPYAGRQAATPEK
jgi:hypothetical protein